MNECKGCATPIDVKTKLHSRRAGEEEVEKVLYQEAVGSLPYAAITTRPDIACATGLVGHFSADPSMLHWVAVKRIVVDFGRACDISPETICRELI